MAAPVSFSARFSGVVENIYIPIHAIKAIYASENGQGLVFPESEIDYEVLEDSSTTDENLSIEEHGLNKLADTKPTTSKKPPTSKKAPSFLKVVK